MKEFTPWGTVFFFPFGVDPFPESLAVQESKKQITEDFPCKWLKKNQLGASKPLNISSSFSLQIVNMHVYTDQNKCHYGFTSCRAA